MGKAHRDLTQRKKKKCEDWTAMNHIPYKGVNQKNVTQKNSEISVLQKINSIMQEIPEHLKPQIEQIKTEILLMNRQTKTAYETDTGSSRILQIDN